MPTCQQTPTRTLLCKVTWTLGSPIAALIMAYLQSKLTWWWQIMSRTSRLTKLSTTTTSLRRRILQSHSQLVKELSRRLLQSTSSQTLKQQLCQHSKPNVIHGKPQWIQLTRATRRLWQHTRTAKASMILPTLFTSPMRMVLRPLAQGLPMSLSQVKKEIQRTLGMSFISRGLTPILDQPQPTLALANLPFRKTTCRLKRKPGGQRHWITMDAATKVSINSCNLQLAANIFRRSQ